MLFQDADFSIIKLIAYAPNDLSVPLKITVIHLLSFNKMIRKFGCRA